MIDALRSEFVGRFGRPPEFGARAPGRVNLIGEHTDYNEGLVLPCAIDRETCVLGARREDGRFRLVSREQPDPVEFAASDLACRRDWSDYARGVVAVLRAELPAGAGADLALASDVPPGSGLSSSAALCVAVVTALDAGFDLGLPARERVDRAHRAERDHVGVPCGIMDPWASGLAEPGAALRIDCRDRTTRSVPLPRRLRLLVVHSGVHRRLAQGDYGDRHAECRGAFRAAQRAGVAPATASALRDLSEADLPALERCLEAIPFRRARHVIRENARVDRFASSLGEDDLAAAGAVLRAGMASLRGDFAVSTPELDALCAIGDAVEGVYGSRLTGAGFGGCTLHVVDADAVETAAGRIASGFETRFGRRPPVHLVVASAGACALGA